MKIIRARLKAYKGSKVAEFISVKGRIKALIEKNVGENFDFVLDDNGRKSVKSFGPDNIDPELVGKEAPIVDNVHFAKFNEDGTIDVIMMEKEGALPRESTVNQLNKIRKATKSTTIDDRVPKLKGANLDYERNYVDSGIESYEDFQKKNKSFTPSWNLKHLKSPFKNESKSTFIKTPKKWLLLIWDNKPGIPDLIMAFTSDDESQMDNYPKGELADKIEKALDIKIEPTDFDQELITLEDFLEDYGSNKNPNKINLSDINIQEF
jgi:hypothetical protein